jgi:hypothetical protein
MANPFEVRVPNALEALMVGEQGYKGMKDIQSQQALQEAGQLYARGDVRGALAAAAKGGNLQALMGLSSLANNERDFAFRQQESQRQQGNSNRAFDFQKQQADEAARGYDLREIDDGAGGKALVRIHKATGRPEKVEVPGLTGTPNNPYIPAGPMNESQSKDALYSNRMLASEKVLREVETQGTSWWERAWSKASDATGYNLRSPEYQKFDQAQRDFINATLRRESGAVISKDEFDNANKQYFPQPGDTADVIKQKRANRAEAIRGIGAGAGKGYRPDSVISPTGEITQNPRSAPQPQPVPNSPGITSEKINAARANPAGTLEEARAALKANPGAREIIIQRLKQAGIDPAGL